MAFKPTIKTILIVLHRYTSAALCLLFSVWFVSGLAMAYRVDPPLTDGERLAFDESLRSPLNARPPEDVPALAAAWPETEIVRLAQLQGRPLYPWRTAGAGWQAAWADSGAPASFDGDSLRAERRAGLGKARDFVMTAPSVSTASGVISLSRGSTTRSTGFLPKASPHDRCFFQAALASR